MTHTFNRTTNQYERTPHEHQTPKPRNLFEVYLAIAFVYSTILTLPAALIAMLLHLPGWVPALVWAAAFNFATLMALYLCASAGRSETE